MAKSDDAKSEHPKADPAKAETAPAKRAGKTGGVRLDARNAADIAFVDALAQLLKDHDLAEVEVEREEGDKELKVRLTRLPTRVIEAQPIGVAAPLPSAPLQLSGPADAAAAAADAAVDPSDDPNCVTSPMVGTVYLAPEPGEPSFVQPGDSVAAGQTLLIIEAMKTMNQIPSPRAGVVKAVLVENEQPVEFGAPLVILS